MSLKRAFYLMVVGVMLATLFAACGDSTATTASTTAAATTARATTAAAVATTAAPAATTAAVATTAATATTAAATTAASATTAATATTAAATTAASATTAAGTTTTAAASATTAVAAASSVIEEIKLGDPSAKKGGTLTYAFAAQFPSQLNPYFAGETVAVGVIRQIYGYLVGQSPNSKYYPYLLSQVPTLENGGVKITGATMDVTLKLKPGLKWSNGDPLTSKDLAYAHKWVTDPANTGIYVDTESWKLISEVQTPDATTAVLKYKQVYGPYLLFLNGYYPLSEKEWGGVALAQAVNAPASTKPTITSGPFKVAEFAAGDRITLERNDNFQPVWGFAPYLDKIIFLSSKDTNAALASVTKGELDMVENLDDNAGEAAKKVPNAKYEIAQQYSWEYLAFNLSNPLFQDKSVRKAISLSLDRDAIIKQFRTEKTLPLAVNFAPISAFADKSLQPDKLNVEQSKKLLEDAGWKVGAGGIREKGGQKLAFTLSSTTAPVRVATAEVMLTYWKAVGIDAKFQAYSSTQFFGPYDKDGILSRGRYDIGMYAQTSDTDPDAGYGNYHSSGIPTEANKGQGANYERLSDKRIDEILDAQRATVDQGKRVELWKEFQKIMSDNTYQASLYTRVNSSIISNKVKNFKSNPTTDSNWWNSAELSLQ